LRPLAPLLLTLALLWPAAAVADVVMPPPERCPRGATGTTSHEGQWCAPTTCIDDGNCWQGRCTEAVGLCITSQQIRCGGRGGWDPNCKVTKTVAHSACSTDSDCATGTCQVASRCTLSWNPLRGSRFDCAGCSAADMGGAGVVSLAVGLGLALLLRRRQ